MVPWGWGLQKWRGGGFSLTHVAPEQPISPPTAVLALRAVISLLRCGPAARPLLPGKGTLFIQEIRQLMRGGPLAAVPSQRGWSGCERYTGMWGEGDHFEIKK